MTLLEVRDLSVSFGEIEALGGVSFTIDEGAVVALLGSNGAGKSTTLRAISGLVAPRAGSILLDGKPITGLNPRTIVKLGVAHVPEGRRIFPGLTVRENIMLGASNGNASSTAIRREADAMYDVFPSIEPFADALGWTLSGGQQQMVAVARGLMAKPRLLLLDEPSLGLAPAVMQAVFQIIAEIHKRGNDGAPGRAERAYGSEDRGLGLCAGDRPARAGRRLCDPLERRTHPRRLPRRRTDRRLDRDMTDTPPPPKRSWAEALPSGAKAS